MWLDSVGNFYSENARVTERFRLASANTMDLPGEDRGPDGVHRAGDTSYGIRRAGTADVDSEPDPYASESWEYACHEGNEQHLEEAHRLGFKWYSGSIRSSDPGLVLQEKTETRRATAKG